MAVSVCKPLSGRVHTGVLKRVSAIAQEAVVFTFRNFLWGDFGLLGAKGGGRNELVCLSPWDIQI